jgi:putative FmdB family regulatory protein
MPIFEYLCTPCNRIFSFLSLSPSPTRKPVCPKCGNAELSRVPSAFAVARKGSDAKPAGDSGAGPDGGDDAAAQRLEAEAMRMASEMDESDAEDPRTVARMMRRLAEASGEPVTPTMEEMFRRMEAGEDPEALEDELGPQLEAEMGDGGEDGAGGAPTRDDGLYGM